MEWERRAFEVFFALMLDALFLSRSEFSVTLYETLQWSDFMFDIARNC